MKLVLGDCIIIEEKYNEFLNPRSLAISYDPEYALLGINPTRIFVRDRWFNTIPYQYAGHLKSKEDNAFHFIYIQINVRTGEYYIGKVNRKKYHDVDKYLGSGHLFKRKYKKHPEDFIKYYLAYCSTAKETEDLEAEIVNDDLLEDPFCLNLCKGGAGGNESYDPAEKLRKQKEFIKNHPEMYRSMLDTAHKMFVENSDELKLRNERIKATHSKEEYRKMSSERIKNWKKNNPEAYAKARENNRIAGSTPESRENRRKAREKWVAEHPVEYEKMKKKSADGNKTLEAKKHHSDALIKWAKEHPEEALELSKKRSKASVEKCRKPVGMYDLKTDELLKTFDSAAEAGRWLIENGYTKGKNPQGSICAVCNHAPCTTGYGYRTKAYGFNWKYLVKTQE